MKLIRLLGIVSLIVLLILTAVVPAYAHADGDGIEIDGYYDDWDGIPKTSISWGDYNGQFHHEGAMIRDDEYIYVYLETHKKYDSQIPLSHMVFSVDGHDARVFLNFVNGDGTGPDWSRGGELYNLSRGVHLGLAPFADYPTYPRGVAAVTIERQNQTGGDKLEFAISIRELALIANVDASKITNGGAVTLYVSDLGPQKLTIVGTSTGTYFGVFLSVLTVAGILAVRKYRRKKSLQ